MGKPAKYDWKKITKEFVEGPCESVKEYIRWNDKRKDMFPEEAKDRPSSHSIITWSQRLGWLDLKKRVHLKRVEKVIDDSTDVFSSEFKEDLKELAKMKTVLTKSMINLIVKLVNNPENLTVKADLSELINDAKLALGMRTRDELRPAGPQINVNQQTANIDSNSRRRELEGATPEQRKQITERDRKINDDLRRQHYHEEDADFEKVE